MAEYYESMYKRVPAVIKNEYPKEVFIPSKEESEFRYGNTYRTVHDSVATQVLPSCPDLRKWNDITNREVKQLYSAIAEDYVEKSLGHKKGPEDNTSGFPLFASKKHSAVNYFLGATIASLTRGKKVKYCNVPAIGG